MVEFSRANMTKAVSAGALIVALGCQIWPASVAAEWMTDPNGPPARHFTYHSHLDPLLLGYANVFPALAVVLTFVCLAFVLFSNISPKILAALIVVAVACELTAVGWWGFEVATALGWISVAGLSIAAASQLLAPQRR